MQNVDWCQIETRSEKQAVDKLRKKFGEILEEPWCSELFLVGVNGHHMQLEPITRLKVLAVDF